MYPFGELPAQKCPSAFALWCVTMDFIRTMKPKINRIQASHMYSQHCSHSWYHQLRLIRRCLNFIYFKCLSSTKCPSTIDFCIFQMCFNRFNTSFMNCIRSCRWHKNESTAFKYYQIHQRKVRQSLISSIFQMCFNWLHTSSIISIRSLRWHINEWTVFKHYQILSHACSSQSFSAWVVNSRQMFFLQLPFNNSKQLICLPKSVQQLKSKVCRQWVI